MSDDAAFLGEIAATPEDPTPYLIYADALRLRGDPRGDLISIQHALETAPTTIAADLRRREAELIAQHPEWCGLDEHRDALVVRWRYGFVHAARLLADDRDQIEPAVAALRALLATPGVSSTLAELHLGSPASFDEDERDAWPSYQPVLDELADHWPPGLRRLHVGDVDLRAMFLGKAIKIPERAKLLDTLVVAGRHVELAWDAAPARLRVFEMRVPDLDASKLLAVREWPQLEVLRFWTRGTDKVVAMLRRAKLPRLRHLGVCGAPNTNALAQELVTHELVDQLAELDLQGGVLSGPGARTLQSIADRVKLDVRHNVLAKPERMQLAAFGATTRPQRRGTRPLTSRAELWRCHERVMSRSYDFEAGDDVAKAYRKLVASTPDPVWLYDQRYATADDFEIRPKRDALRELAVACRAALVHPESHDPAELYYAVGEHSDALVEGFEAETWLWQAVIAARWSTSAAMEARALGLIGTIRMRRGEPDVAAPILDSVLAHFQAHGSRSEQAWALRQRGNVELVRSKFADAETYYRRALELYRAGNHTNDVGIVLSELAGVSWSRQDFEGAVAMLRESIGMRPPDSIGLGSNYYNLGAVLNGMGKLDEAREAGERSLAIFRKHQRSDGASQALSLLGELAQRSLDHDKAQQLLDEALAYHRGRGAKRETGVTLGNLSRVALDRAQYPRARTYCEEAVELHREVGNKYNEGLQLLGLVDAAIGEGRLDDALAIADEALVPLVEITNLPGMAAVKMRRGYVAMLRGGFAEAEAHFAEAVGEALRGNYPELVGWTSLYRAIGEAKRGRHGETAALVDDAGARLATSTQGQHALEMVRAVLARLAGEARALPEARTFDARLLASFAS